MNDTAKKKAPGKIAATRDLPLKNVFSKTNDEKMQIVVLLLLFSVSPLFAFTSYDDRIILQPPFAIPTAWRTRSKNPPYIIGHRG